MEIKHYARKELDFDPKGTPLLWPSPSLQLALNYNTGISLECHPCPEYLTIDWLWPGMTPWTSDAVALLAREFYMKYQEGRFPGIRRELKKDQITALFAKYILRMKRHYKRTMKEVDPFDYFQRLFQDDTVGECECDYKEEEQNKPEDALQSGGTGLKMDRAVVEYQSKLEESIEDLEGQGF
jgi:hypothetical protein